MSLPRFPQSQPTSLVVQALLLALAGCSTTSLGRGSTLQESCIEYSSLCDSEMALSLERALEDDWLTVASTVPVVRESCETAAACWEQEASNTRSEAGRQDRLLLAGIARWRAEALAAVELHAQGWLEGSCEELEQAVALYLRALTGLAPVQRALQGDPGGERIRTLRSAADALLSELRCR